MKISAKAQIEVSFHWIFILIAGGAILAFFLMITKGEKETSDKQLVESIGTRLEALLSTLQQNPDAAQIQETLNTELEFKCEQDGHTYTLKEGDRRFSLHSQIIFSPEKIGESKIITWTKLYSAPYPVTQILYLSDEKTKYLFLDLESTKKYYDMMPEIFEKNLINKSELEKMEDQGFRTYIIITDNSNLPLNLKNSLSKKAKIVKINQNSITFSTSSQNSNLERAYVNDETILGAIISGNPQLYGCAMEKLMQASRITGEINLKRTELISLNIQNRCEYFYQLNIPQEYIRSIIGNSSYSSNANSYQDLIKAIDDLNKLNDQMLRATCPTIY